MKSFKKHKTVLQVLKKSAGEIQKLVDGSNIRIVVQPGFGSFDVHNNPTGQTWKLVAQCGDGAYNEVLLKCWVPVDGFPLRMGYGGDVYDVPGLKTRIKETLKFERLKIVGLRVIWSKQ